VKLIYRLGGSMSLHAPVTLQGLAVRYCRMWGSHCITLHAVVCCICREVMDQTTCHQPSPPEILLDRPTLVDGVVLKFEGNLCHTAVHISIADEEVVMIPVENGSAWAKKKNFSHPLAN